MGNHGTACARHAVGWCGGAGASPGQYFIIIIGFWKVLGVVALLAPRFPLVKEWAYAGIFFNMTGAFVSHAVCGDGAGHLVATGSLALLTVASWVLPPEARKLLPLRS